MAYCADEPSGAGFNPGRMSSDKCFGHLSFLNNLLDNILCV